MAKTFNTQEYKAMYQKYKSKNYTEHKEGEEWLCEKIGDTVKYVANERFGS